MNNPNATPHPQTAEVHLETPSGRAKLHVEYERPTPNTVKVTTPDRRALSLETATTIRRLLAGLFDTSLRAIDFPYYPFQRYDSPNLHR